MLNNQSASVLSVAQVEANTMFNQISLFENPSFGSVRVIMRGEDPWFVAADVCKCLGYQRTSDGLSHCKKAEIVQCGDLPQCVNSGFSVPPSGLNIIPESDLYRLIMRSHLPNAEAFQDWVVEDVLPSIRKTGMYMPNFNDPVEAAEAWLKAEKSRRAAEEQARLEAEAHAKTQRALTQKTDALGEILNEWGEGETFRSCIAQAKIFSQWYNIRYITDAGDKFYGSLGRLMTCLCNGGLTSTGKPATKDPRFIGHKFEWKYESHPAAAFGGWNIYHVDAWQYLIDIVKQDGAGTIPFIGKFAL